MPSEESANLHKKKKTPPDPHFTLSCIGGEHRARTYRLQPQPWRAKLAHLEDGDDGPQQGVEILPVRNCISCVRPEAELATKDVHSQDAIGTGRGISGTFKSLCHYCELLRVIPPSNPT